MAVDDEIGPEQLEELRLEPPTPWAPSTSRIAAHAALLVVVLLCLAPLVGVDRAVFDADEGGYLLQIDVLERTGEVFTDYWAADLDETLDFVPVEHAVTEGDALAPTVTRPALTLLLYALHAAGGLLAATAFGCAAVGATAASVALITREMRPHLAIAALWTTGLATPLAFDAFVLRGHGIGAALSGVATLAAVRTVLSRPAPVRLIALVVSLAAAGMVRKEALFVAAGLAVSLAVVGIVHRRLRTLLPVAVLAASGAVLAVAGDLLLSRLWLGRGETRAVPSASDTVGSFIDERVRSAWTATFRPVYEVAGHRPAGIALLAAVAVGAVAVSRYGRRREAHPLAIGLAVALALILVRVLFVRSPPDLVPGLFAASPLVLWGLLSLRRGHLRPPAALLLGVAAMCFGTAVVATQYPIGGAWEWGARYLEAGLPLVIPLVVIGLADMLGGLAANRSTAPMVMLAAISVTMTTSGLVAQRESRLRVEEQLETSLALAETTESEVVVSTFPSLPRSATGMFREEQRWLWTWPDGLPELLRTLERGDLHDAVLVTHDDARTDAYLERTGWERGTWDELPANPGTWYIATVRRTEVAGR